MDRYASYEYIAVSIDDRVATLTLNRPEKLNACRVKDHAELIQILRDIQDDDDVAAAVVTGAGRAFSVGGDIELLEQVAVDDDVLHQLLHDAKAVIDAHEALDKPIIAAINGWAMGAGLAFALLCDMIYAERGVMMADGHIRAAIAAGDAGALIWPLTVGLTKSKRYLMTGDAIDADEAERIGLITEVVEPGTSLAVATAMARRLADGPQLAIRYTKRALNQWLRLGSVTAFDYSVALEMLTFRSADFRLAVENLKASKTPAIAPPAG
jgi:enoyl-CoA hydratase